MAVKIEYLPKEKMGSNFGLWIHDNVTGDVTYQIREDLPKCMQEFILEHEKRHEKQFQTGTWDPNKWFENELDANLEAFKKHKLGALVTIIYSLAPYRLYYYYTRFKNKK